MNGEGARLRLNVTWPLTILFVCFPFFWVLGISSFLLPLLLFPMLIALIYSRRTHTPAALVLWLAFISWALLSGFELQTGSSVLTFCYRISLYFGSAILFLYVYNLPASSRLDSKVLKVLTIFWMIVVAGGFAGIILRSHSFTPPIELLLPHSLRSHLFVQELVQPVFAQVQSFLGFPVPRPAAPFAYTNEWGGNIAALTPVAFASLATAGRGRWRTLVVVVLALSVVPMVFSLNRGMFLSLGIGMMYVTVRLAMRGRLGALATLLAVCALGVAIVALTPLGHLLLQSLGTSHGHSNQTRLSLEQQAVTGVNKSPMFGYGAPRPAVGQIGSPPIGTQGQLWTILYSSGYPAAIFFVGFALVAIWQTRRAKGTAGLWLHCVPLIALAQTPVYGWLPTELQVLMVALALAYRRCDGYSPPPLRSRSPATAEPLPGAPPPSPWPPRRPEKRRPVGVGST